MVAVAMRMHFHFALHQHAAAAVGKHAVPHRRPLLAARFFEPRLELTSVCRFNELELIALVRHADDYRTNHGVSLCGGCAVGVLHQTLHRSTPVLVCVAKGTVTEHRFPISLRKCPVCDAADAFVDTLREGEEYYVECVNCRVYRASRRAFRHFEYLREKGDTQSLERLGKLAAALKTRGRGAAVHLEYDTWHRLLEAPIW
jgi:Zn ribbon nucleic-acid-binding protein